MEGFDSPDIQVEISTASNRSAIKRCKAKLKLVMNEKGLMVHLDLWWRKKVDEIKVDMESVVRRCATKDGFRMGRKFKVHP